MLEVSNEGSSISRAPLPHRAWRIGSAPYPHVSRTINVSSSNCGAASAALWMHLGRQWMQLGLSPRAAYMAVYAAYLGGSVLFVGKKMREWRVEY